MDNFPFKVKTDNSIPKNTIIIKNNKTTQEVKIINLKPSR